jgi:hypothetical protein
MRRSRNTLKCSVLTKKISKTWHQPSLHDSALAGDFGKKEWDELKHAIKTNHGMADVPDIYKCSAFIQLLLSEMWDAVKKCLTLERLSKAIVSFAQTQTE